MGGKNRIEARECLKAGLVMLKTVLNKSFFEFNYSLKVKTVGSLKE